MKNKIAVAISLALGAGLASAAPAQKLPSLGSDGQEKTPYVFAVSVTNHVELYEEFYQGEKLMEEEAHMTGIKLGVERDFTNGGTLGLQAHFALGNAKYTGSYWGGSYGDVKESGIDRSLIELNATYTHRAPEWQGVAPSIGLGFRQLNDHLDQIQGGYERENNRVYLALGLERPFALSKALTVTPAARYKQSLWSQQFSDIYGGLIHRQTSGNGYDVSVEVEYKRPNYAVAVTPYLRTWDMAASQVVSNTLEPKNETREVGFELTAKF